MFTTYSDAPFSSAPAAPTDDSAAWWSQRVVFDGGQATRSDLFYRLSARPGATVAEVRSLLEAAPPADGDAGPKPGDALLSRRPVG